MRSLARRFSPDIRQIDLDVNRTYRDHIDFRERYGERQVRRKGRDRNIVASRSAGSILWRLYFFTLGLSFLQLT